MTMRAPRGFIILFTTFSSVLSSLLTLIQPTALFFVGGASWSSTKSVPTFNKDGSSTMTSFVAPVLLPSSQSRCCRNGLLVETVKPMKATTTTTTTTIMATKMPTSLKMTKSIMPCGKSNSDKGGHSFPGRDSNSENGLQRRRRRRFSSSNKVNIGAKRRDALNQMVQSIIFPAVSSILMLNGPNPPTAQAACLSGDTSKECIGTYKLPLDDEVLPYIDTPEKLQRYAPDVNKWVPPIQYPSSYKDALVELRTLQQRCLALKDVVLRGELESAGVELLSITPRVTVAGRVVVGALLDAGGEQQQQEEDNKKKKAKVLDNKEKGNKKGGDTGGGGKNENLSMRAYRAEVSFSELQTRLGQCDILIGQGLRGELGVIAPAQIQILAALKDVNNDFDEFLRAIPEGFTGTSSSSSSSRPDRRKLSEQFHEKI